MRTLIIGHGIVGKNMQKIFPDSDIYDLASPESIEKGQSIEREYDLAFVCVPTPSLEDGSCDTSIVETAIRLRTSNVKAFCIKSTIPPGTTTQIKNNIFPHVVFSPEYFGATQHANSHDYDFVIIGGGGYAADIVAQAYASVYPGSFRILKTDAKTAELVKYGENCWIAAKVSFCNEFARLCEIYGVDYVNWRELFLADPRINPSHTFVYPDRPYFDSHCLNKDIPAIIKAAEKAGYSPLLLRSIEEYNQRHKGR